MSEETYNNRKERKQAEKTKGKQQQRNSKRPKIGSLIKKVLIVCLVLGVLSTGAGVITFASMINDAPALDSSKLADPLSTKFYDINGNFIYEYGKEKRTKITYDQVPKILEQAFIATEDSRFYEHHGIDIKRTTKAIFVNLTEDFGSQGGSTITQQVIKNSFLTPEKTLKRKVQEWDLAYQLEQEYSKQEILMMYLNKIYLGNRSYGIAAAAKNYYGLEVEDLEKMSLSQAAMIAGLPQAPNKYDPTKPENIEAATNRRDLVLRAMVRQGYITEKQMEETSKIPVTEGLVSNSTHQSMPYEAFLDAAVKEVKEIIKGVDVSTDGLSIYTTMDPNAQEYAEKILNTNEIIAFPDENFQGAFVLIDTKTGEVRAIGSGRNEYKAQFLGHNFAIEMQRQPGSTFKPIFDYGPAIEHLKWSTAHLINDEKTTYSNGDSISNWDRQHHGIMTIRTALQYSYNIPALLTMREVGIERSKTFAEQLGISFKNDKVYESYSIGSNSVNPLVMAGAYSSFGNGGVYNRPHFVNKVVFPDGKEVNFSQEPKKVMEDYTAYMVTDMLRTVVDEGTGKLANIVNLDVAGKTGTTNFDEETRVKNGYPNNATNDSWFVGYTPQYTMAVWTGYAQNAPGNYLVGETTKISHRMFKVMMEKYATDTTSFQQPKSVYKVNNELYITGVDSAEVPFIPSIIKETQDYNKWENKWKEKKWKKEDHPGRGKDKGKGKDKDRGKKKDDDDDDDDDD